MNPVRSWISARCSRAVLPAFLALALIGCASLPPAPASNLERLIAELERLESDGFVGQVAIAHGDQVLLNRGFGTMAPDDPRPVTEMAVMPLASLTKPFTASAVFALAAEGRLGLEDPIGSHVPGLDPAWAAVAVYHYLTHTAGLPAEIINRNYPGQPRFEPVEREEFLRRLAHFRPDHPPGASYNYSNVGYNLLAVLIEHLAEQDYEAFIAGTLLGTAGIRGIGFRLPAFDERDLVVGRDGPQAVGHYFDQPRLDDGLGWHLRGAGDLLARPAAIIAWWQSIRHQTWLSQPWLDRWLEPQVNEPDGSRYGFGLHFRSSPFGPVIGHTGGDFTFAVDFSWFVDHDLMVYFATADARFEADVLRDWVHGVLMDP